MNGPFSMAMLNNQRVYTIPEKPMLPTQISKVIAINSYNL